MADFLIKKGRNIQLKGSAEKTFIDLPLPKQAAIQPPDFRGLKPRLAVKVEDEVKVGSPLLTDKVLEGLKVVSPLSGRVAAINRGEKRALLSIVIESDGRQEAETFAKYNEGEIPNISKEDTVKQLLDGGLWPVIRQRPFSKIANPEDTPKSIFIHAMNTEPLAADIDFILEQKEKEFQVGIDIIKKLTQGHIHLCVDANAKSAALTTAQNARIHRFSGAHPAGNVSTHIHYVDPIKKGDCVWYVEAQDILRIASLFLKGVYPAERVIAVTGDEVKKRNYVRACMGTSLFSLLEGSDLQWKRYLSGSVLTGRNVGVDGFLGFYDSQISVISQGGNREFLGWLSPGLKKFTFSKTFASSFLPKGKVSLDTDTHGSDRAIVLNHIYDSLNTLDILTYFLLKAVISGDIEEAEKLGILECDEEDFALCTFACPSKTDVGSIIREGLDLIEKEG